MPCHLCLSVLSVTLAYCGQTVERIKMKLGMEVDLGPGHMVLDGDPAPLPKRGTAPYASVFVLCFLLVYCTLTMMWAWPWRGRGTYLAAPPWAAFPTSLSLFTSINYSLPTLSLTLNLNPKLPTFNQLISSIPPILRKSIHNLFELWCWHTDKWGWIHNSC